MGEIRKNKDLETLVFRYRQENMAEYVNNEMASVKYEENYKSNSYLHKQVDKLLRKQVWLNKCLSDEQKRVKALQDENEKLQMILHNLEKEEKIFHKDFREIGQTVQNNSKHLTNVFENRQTSKCNPNELFSQNNNRQGNVKSKVEMFNRYERHNEGTADLQLTQRRLVCLNCENVTQRKQILEKECMLLQNELDKLHRDNKHLREKLEYERNTAEQYTQDYTGYQLKFDILSKENINLNAVCETNEKQTFELKEQVKQLLQEKEKLSKDLCHEVMLRQTKEAISSTCFPEKNERLKFDDRNTDLYVQVQQLLKENDKLKKDLVHERKLKTPREKQIMQERNKNLQNKVNELLHEQQTLECDFNVEKENLKTTEELLERIHDMQLKIENKDQEIISFRMKLKNVNEFTSANRNIDSRLGNKLDSNEVLQQQLTDAKVRLINTQKELDDTKTRLSRAMGDKLTDNNPNIADLSDKNRPTKISERYQELYDNQWTDAFEIIDSMHRSEEKTIEVLKEILLETMTFCKTEAANQMLNLQATLLKGEECSPGVYKQAKDIRKAVAELYGKGLYKEYWTTMSKTSFAKHIPNFVNECFDVCWLMVVQDPPVVFGYDNRRHDIFNKDHYKSYTRGGNRIDYVVWPVLLLHLNGPVLCKGVAQGMET